jgi:peptidoglycan/LPS O-acetylase OafA/YrhL
MKSSDHPYLTTLTPLRGIAALLVVIFHCNLMFRQFLPSGHTKFLDNSWLWVDFFFVLSGFIMFYAYKKYFKKTVSVADFKKYMGARFARIYPLYFFTTIWAFISCVLIVKYSAPLDPFMAEIINPKALPASLLLVQSMHVGYFTAPLNTPAWSLSTEWWAYVIFPFLVPLFLSLKAMGKMLALILIAAFFIVLRYKIGPISYGNPGPTMNVLTDFGFLRCLAGFLTGMLLYVFFEHRSGFALIKKDWFFFLSFFGVMAAMHFGVMDIIIIVFFPLIILSAAYNDGHVKRILDSRMLQRLGDWSFTIYLVHVPIILMFYVRDIYKNPKFMTDPAVWTTPHYLHALMMCGLVITLTLVTSSLVYRFVEVPARNYFNRIFNTQQPKILVESIEV